MARLLTAKRKQRKSDVSKNVHSFFYRKHEFLIIRWPFHDMTRTELINIIITRKQAVEEPNINISDHQGK